jgi:hypothetical protein
LLLRLLLVSILWQSVEPPPHIPTTLGVVPVLPACLPAEEEGSWTSKNNKALGDKSKKKPKKKKKNEMKRVFPSEK